MTLPVVLPLLMVALLLLPSPGCEGALLPARTEADCPYGTAGCVRKIGYALPQFRLWFRVLKYLDYVTGRFAERDRLQRALAERTRQLEWENLHRKVGHANLETRLLTKMNQRNEERHLLALKKLNVTEA